MLSPADRFATVESWQVPRLRKDTAKKMTTGPTTPTGTGWTLATLLDELRGRGLRVEKRGRHWWSQCPCPEHRDRNPSVQIRVGRTGVVIAKCQSRCTQNALWTAIGAPAGWQDQPLAIKLPDHPEGCLCLWHRVGLEHGCGVLSSDDQADCVSFLHSEQRQRVQRVRTVPSASYDCFVLLGAVSPEMGDEPCAQSEALIGLPQRMGKVQRAVLADLVALVNARLEAGDERAVPYASGWAADRLAIDARRIREALQRLRNHGLIEKAGELPNGRDDGLPLYALAVRAPCPLCASDIERAAVVALADEPTATATDAEGVVEPRGEVVEDVPVLLAEGERVVGAGLAAAQGGAGLGVVGHAAERYARSRLPYDPRACPF